MKPFAIFFRYIFNPILIPSYLFAILIFSSSLISHYPPALQWRIMEIIAISTIGTIIWSFIPYKIISRLLSSKNGNLSSDTTPRYKRFLISFVVVSSYILAIILVSKFFTLKLTLRILLAPIIFIVFQAIFSTLRSELSSWSGSFGISATIIYLFILYGITGLFAPLLATIIIGGAVASSQIYLKKDTLFTSLLGCLIGITSALISFIVGGLI